MLWEFPNLTLSSKLLDAHVYVLRRGVLDLLLERPQIASIREDLLPWLSKWSYQSGLAKKWNHALNIPEDPFSDAIKYSTMQTYASKESTHIPPQQRPRVQCYIHDPKDGVIGRANTLGGYAELNREQLRQHRPQPNVKTVAPGSLTSENVKVGEKSLIKMSIIGRNVDIGKGCKIIGSIIADNVVIKDGAKLDNCIVCTRAKIGERATLTLCDVGGDSDVISDSGCCHITDITSLTLLIYQLTPKTKKFRWMVKIVALFSCILLILYDSRPSCVEAFARSLDLCPSPC